jgi:hypothetical protein
MYLEEYMIRRKIKRNIKKINRKIKIRNLWIKISIIMMNNNNTMTNNANNNHLNNNPLKNVKKCVHSPT